MVLDCAIDQILIVYLLFHDICSSIVTPVMDHYVLVSGGGVRVSDVTRREGV